MSILTVRYKCCGVECHESRSHQRSIVWRQQEDGDCSYLTRVLQF